MENTAADKRGFNTNIPIGKSDLNIQEQKMEKANWSLEAQKLKSFHMDKSVLCYGLILTMFIISSIFRIRMDGCNLYDFTVFHIKTGVNGTFYPNLMIEGVYAMINHFAS